VRESFSRCGKWITGAVAGRSSRGSEEKHLARTEEKHPQRGEKERPNASKEHNMIAFVLKHKKRMWGCTGVLNAKGGGYLNKHEIKF
jgi:hypothetical protein